MKDDLQKDMERLQGLAFAKVSGCAEFLQRFHEMTGTGGGVVDRELLEKVYRWAFVPLSLWPEDLKGFGMHILERTTGRNQKSEGGSQRSEGGIDPAAKLMARLLPEAPGKNVCGPIADYEHAVKAGSYELLVAAQSKFDALERELRENPELKADWEEIKALFDVSKYQNAAGVIRRRLVQERNFRPADWKFSWETEAQRFQNVFDAFCHKWDLYGMERRQTSSKLALTPALSPWRGRPSAAPNSEGSTSSIRCQGVGREVGEKGLLSPGLSPTEPVRPLRGEGEKPADDYWPLLLKLTVTITPYGTIIMVPKYWSFDPRRDLNWKEVAKLHRTRSAHKLGPKLVLNQAERREEAKRASVLWAEATEAGLRGEKREQWVMGRLGWDARTDESRLKRLMKGKN